MSDGTFIDYSGSFDTTFGAFVPLAVYEPIYKPTVITLIDDGRAHPCNHCGKFPRIHDVCFKNKKKNPNHFYIDCEVCNSCSGEWYATVDDAISAWNEANPLTEVSVDNEQVERFKVISESLENCKFD